ncbi:MAG: M23 family metallopeptidase [Treponema sp.]|nr:M23 family metallopeptidase [Treponema sp.]
MKKLTTVAVGILFITSLSAFNWPHPGDVTSNSFSTYFGQFRGETVSTSLIFETPAEIVAADDGAVLIVLNEHDDDCAFFPSALGTAIIVAHNDALLTVYGNIDSESVSESIQTAEHITAGTVLGHSGNSAWQQRRNSLEFQIIDGKMSTAINPRIIMPRIDAELPLTIGSLTLEAHDGTQYAVSNGRRIPKGLYRVYKERQQRAVPYRTRIDVNGVLLDEISYDVLSQNGAELVAQGRHPYPLAALYPDDARQLLGEASFTSGRTVLTVTLTDILGHERSASWTFTVY